MIYLISTLKNFKNEKYIIEEKCKNLLLNNNYIKDEFIKLIDKYTTIKINLNTNLAIIDNLFYKNSIDYIIRKNIEKVFYKNINNAIEKYIVMTKIKNEYLKYEFYDDEYIERYFVDLNIDFLYKQINFYHKVYRNNKIEELTLMENLNEMIYLIHNDEYKYML